MNLRTYFALVTAALVGSLAAILSTTISYISSDEIKRQTGESLSDVAFQMSNNLDYFMWARFGEVKLLSELDSLKKTGNEEEIQRLLNKLSEEIPSFSWVGLTDEKGLVVASTKGILTGGDISERPVFMNAQEDTFIGDVHDAVLLAKLLPNPTGEPLQFVDISTPITGADGKFKGVLAAHLSWAWAKEIKENVFKPLESGKKNIEVFVVSSENNTVILGPEDSVGKPLELESITSARKKGEGWIEEEWSGGTSYLTGYSYGKGYSTYPGLGWTVIVRQSVDDAYIDLKDLQVKTLITGIIFALVFALIGWYLAGQITKPLNRITLTAQQLRYGKSKEIPVVKGIKEIESLSSSLRDLIHDLTYTETQLGKMEILANRDSLTGLPNRLALEQFMDIRMKDTSDTFLFLFLDLDGFKQVNDVHGHSVGDSLLKHVSIRLMDIMWNEGFLCRLGGDEFIIISSCSEMDRDHETIVGSIIEELNKPFLIEGKTVKVGCSIGGTIWTNGDLTPEEALDLADKALYESKRAGKNKACFL